MHFPVSHEQPSLAPEVRRRLVLDMLCQTGLRDLRESLHAVIHFHAEIHLGKLPSPVVYMNGFQNIKAETITWVRRKTSATLSRVEIPPDVTSDKL